VKRLKVLVAEDSLTIRRRLCEILAADPDLEVVGEAENGKRAIELCEAMRPDVITLDMVMPVMSGLTATEYIMAYMPTPILIVSASTNRGELLKTYDALAAGAVDVLEKPAADDVDGAWERRFIAAVKLIAKIRVITHPRARLSGRDLADAVGTPPAAAPRGRAQARASRVLALGASTGGPAAIVKVLRDLPVPLPVPALLVLHIDEPFASAFAEWLDSQTPHPVAYARDGDRIETLTGRVGMAPPGRHLTVAGGRIRLTQDPPRHSCRPSVDALFESLAQDCGDQVTACLLTGMGRDGAAGLLAIRRAGGTTLAQDEASSVVYGMPREAALLGAAQTVLPLDQIGAEIGHTLARGGGAPV
jgi:two-component system, chemotaxis family, protein-glutamate methylesterase/glutaminase